MSESDIATALSYMWSKILVLDEVGLEKSIFDLGARSLDVMTAVNHLRATVAPNLSAMLFFEHPTVLEQSRRLAAYSSDELLL